MESDGNRENFVNDGLSVVNGSSPSSSSASGSRWNPTKEQINILENLYRQGLRTPTADQIQEITSRLRAFGHIEGKNVFYWFQNHKARQRQKQKQDNLAYFTSFLHKIPPPIFTPQYPCPNVVCSQYLIPLQSNDISFVPQYHPNKVPNPGGMMRRRPRANDQMLDNLKASITYEFDDHQETLALFPLHPTDILHKNIEEPSSAGRSYCSSTTLSSSFDIDDGPAESHKPSYYDFFSSVKGCCDHERDY